MDTEALIKKYTEMRKEQQLTQRRLADLSSIPQPAIARLESNSPKGVHIDTLNALLSCMGYTLDIVPVKTVDDSYTSFLERAAEILDRKAEERKLLRKKSIESLKKDARELFKGAMR